LHVRPVKPALILSLGHLRRMWASYKIRSRGQSQARSAPIAPDAWPVNDLAGGDGEPGHHQRVIGAAKQPDAGLGPCAPLDPRLAVGAARTLS